MTSALRAGAAIMLIFSCGVQAEVFESSSRHPMVIELFTSEGCSSCPPAEYWLNHFSHNESLWREIFPIAWHVDYWDYLGWSDRFADNRFSQRQRLYRSQTPLKSVYTPAVLVNGKPWRGWVRGGEPDSDTGNSVGTLRVELNWPHFNGYFATSEGGSFAKTAELHAAVLGFGLSSEVRRGENAGKRLPHEFVVLAEQRFGRAKDRWSGALPLLPKVAEEAGKLAVVFWLEKPGSPIPVQITGGWIGLDANTPNHARP